MGLLDCVSDQSGKYPVSPPGESPLSRGSNISGRRSLSKKSLFSSNNNIKGKDVDFWRQRVLRFIYKTEGREDIRDLRMPLKQLGYNTIVDFIRGIPPEIYEPFKNQLNPDTGLRKDYKVIWERDGITEPGIFKWEGPIDGKRCMGLQLDKKKAVPYNCFDGKGLFYCKPGHRALVPIEEVYPYKEYLRQFVGLPPRKDSMPLNLGLRPGRSSVRLTVTKKYTPGDRVHLPNEDKWATILWTGRIDGEWVVDLVYDPEKPATGRMASPDEPCMSRSLSFADFIDQLGSPPKHIPTPPPKTPDMEDDVFESRQDEDDEVPQVINQDDGLVAPPKLRNLPSESDLSSDDTLPDDKTESESEQSVADPGIESESDDSYTESDGGTKFRRTYSEPVPEVKKSPDPKRQELKDLDVFQPKPLQSRPTHKPLFNLASFGSSRKKKEKSKPVKQHPIEVETEVSSPPRNYESSPKKEFSFFSRNKSKSPPKTTLISVEVEAPKSPEVPEIREQSPGISSKGLDFFRRDRSRSPVNRKSDRKIRTSSGGEHREVPIDVPQSMRSPVQKEVPLDLELALPDPPRRTSIEDDSSDGITSPLSPSPPTVVEKLPSPRVVEKIGSPTFVEKLPSPRVVEKIGSPTFVETLPSPRVVEKISSPTFVENLPSPRVVEKISSPTFVEKLPSPRIRQSSSEESTDEDDRASHKSDDKKPEMPKSVQIEVEVQLNERSAPDYDSDHGSYSSVSSVPYSPAIKDVGFKVKPAKKPENQKVKSNPLKSFKSYFSSKKPLPPKDYVGIEEAKPSPPIRKESLEEHDKLEDKDSISSLDDHVSDGDYKPKRKSSLKRSQGGLFSMKKPKTTKDDATEELPPLPMKPPPLIPTSPVPSTMEPLGDQDGLTLDLLDVRDDQGAWNSSSPVPTETGKKRDSKGKTFSFGFSKKSKPSTTEITTGPSLPQSNVVGHVVQQQPTVPSTSSISSQDDVKITEETRESTKAKVVKPKRESLKESFTRTFSFTKTKRKGSFETYEKLDDFSEQKPQTPRPISLYIDNNEAIGATRITRPKSKSTSVLIDIQPWNERMGHKSDILGLNHHPSDDDEMSPNGSQGSKTLASSKSVPALNPKRPEPVIPEHRKFTTPKIFKWSPKSNVEPPKPPAKPKKKSSFKGSALKSPPPKVTTPEIETREIEVIEPPTVTEEVISPVSEPPPIPKSAPPPLPQGPPPITPRSPKSPKSPTITTFTEVVPNRMSIPSSPQSPSPLQSQLAPKLKSAMKQRKEIGSIPKGLKIGDRVIWYSGRVPVPGNVMKLYKDGTDKYTAVVKFDREPGKEPLSLIREGEGYIVTVEELITPEVFGISSVSSSPPTSPIFPVVKDISINNDETVDNEIAEPKTPSVRFEPSSTEPAVPNISIQPATPGSPPPKSTEFGAYVDDSDNNIPPPFQEEEIEIACGLRRGIPTREPTCCLETLLFAMFYTTNTFDTSILYENGFEEDILTRDAKAVLRHEIVHPLRQSGFCEWSAVKKLRDLMKNLDADFDPLITDAEIMTSILFERALKLGKFISYSNGVTDYLHQLVFDPRDLSKSSTIQQLLETSLELMDNSKLRTVPTPALILEIPRANDKFLQYEAVVPNLSVMISHLLQNGPRLCLCGLVAKYECPTCLKRLGSDAIGYCDSCRSMADQQIHFKLDHDPNLIEITQQIVTMDLVSVICIQGGHYTAFVKCGSQRLSPWLFYDAAEVDNPKVSLEHNLGMWIDRLEKYPGKYGDAFAHPLLTHFLANSHICVYQSREKSSLV